MAATAASEASRCESFSSQMETHECAVEQPAQKLQADLRKVEEPGGCCVLWWRTGECRVGQQAGRRDIQNGAQEAQNVRTSYMGRGTKWE